MSCSLGVLVWETEELHWGCRLIDNRLNATLKGRPARRVVFKETDPWTSC